MDLFFFLFLSSAVWSLKAPSTWVIKQQQEQAAWNSYKQLLKAGLVEFFPLDLSPFHSVFREHHCTGWYKSYRDTMHLQKCNAGGRWKVWALPSWEWGEESKQAQRPVAPTYLQHIDGQMHSNITQEERKIQISALECAGRISLFPAQKNQPTKTNQPNKKKP